jgi:putative flavoprotein involved in K+ transport
MTERFDTIVIGGGQAGLVTGYELMRRGRPFVVLDANERIGDAWRARWDSLRLFTPAKYDGLPGMRFPAPRLSFPTKDEVADYMETYARTLGLPVRTGVRVERMRRERGFFFLDTNVGPWVAGNVIVATGANRMPHVPDFAGRLDPRITQMHSSAYRNPGQLRQGALLVVGLGNSGAEISWDLRKGRQVFLSGRPSGELPVRHGPAAALFVLPLVKFVGTHVLNLDTPVGRKVLPRMRSAPLIRVKTKDLEAAGIERVARVVGVKGGLPLLGDGRTLDVANVIWCTGYRAGLEWIAIPRALAEGRPLQHRGVAREVPGLYFVGMEHQYSAGSDVLGGVARDARYVAARVAMRALTAGAHRLDAEDGMVGRDAPELVVR